MVTAQVGRPARGPVDTASLRGDGTAGAVTGVGSAVRVTSPTGRSSDSVTTLPARCFGTAGSAAAFAAGSLPVTPSAASRCRSVPSAREVWLFTVPAEMSSIAAVCASDMSS